jgi:hypothetical protein
MPSVHQLAAALLLALSVALGIVRQLDLVDERDAFELATNYIDARFRGDVAAIQAMTSATSGVGLPPYPEASWRPTEIDTHPIGHQGPYTLVAGTAHLQGSDATFQYELAITIEGDHLVIHHMSASGPPTP